MKIVYLIFILFSIVFSKELKVGAGFSLEPYIIKKGDKGIELDIIKTIFKNQGINNIKIVYLPLVRIPCMIKKKKIDIALTINENSGIKNIFYSKVYISYSNVLISNKNLTINKISDLKGLKIISFQNSTKYLGKEYKNIISKLKFYKELADALLQIKLLFAKRVDAIVIDINIFKYLIKQIKDKNVNLNQKIFIFNIFPKIDYKVAFLNKKLRDKFNKGLIDIKNKGTYKKILYKYIKGN